MKKHSIFLLFFLGVFFASGALNLHAQNAGITVKIGGMVTGSYVSITGSSTCMPSTDIPGGIFGFGQAVQTTPIYWNGTAQYLPDKDYQFFYTSSPASGGPGYGGGGGFIAFAAPPGYRVQVNHQFTTYFNVPSFGYANNTGSSSGSFQFRIVSSLAAAGGRAGSASSITSGQVRWSVALGALKNGSSAGSISIVDAGTETGATPWSGLFTPAALQYLSASAEIVTYNDAAGQLRQVLADQADVDIVTISPGVSYEIRFYSPSQLQGTAFPYTFSGTPYVKYLVRQGATATTLQILSTTLNLTSGSIARYAVTTLTRSTLGSGSFQWVMDDWNDCDLNGNVTAGQQVREENRVWAGTASDPTETLTVYQPGQPVDLTVNNTYHVFNWGQQSVSTTTGSVNPTPASTVNFFTSGGTTSANYGLPLSTVGATGTWTAFDYTPGTDVRWFWAINHLYRPFNAQAMPATFSPSVGEVTTFQYVLDAAGAPTQPTSIVTQINGVTTAQSTVNYLGQTGPDGQTIVVATQTDYGSSSAASALTSVTSKYSELLADDFFIGQIRSTVQPDGAQASYAYQRGTFNAGQTGQAAFTASTSGTGSSIAVITGSSLAANGTTCTSYNGFILDPIYLVDGKSTLQVTLRDATAFVRCVQSYAWVSGGWALIGNTNFTYDASGQLTGTSALNGATTGTVYNGEQVQSSTDASGVTVGYTYDHAGRVLTAAKSTGPTTTYGYNSNGQVVSQSVSDGGVDAAITSYTAFDDAGRVKNETPAGVSPVTYTYGYGTNAGGVANATFARTANFPDGGMRIEASQLDGRPLSVSGTAVVEQDFTYALDAVASGFIDTTVHAGSAASTRWSTDVTDWLGRTVTSTHPGFTGQPNFVQTNIYDNGGTGHLLEMDRTGYAPVKYQYDAFGSVIRSGLDLGNDNLALASSDVIADSNQFIEAYTPAGSPAGYWLHQESVVYPLAGSGAQLKTSIVRKRLTGFAVNRLEETQTTDAYANIGIHTTDVNTAAKTLTLTTTLPGVTHAQIETVSNSLRTSIVGINGLTTNFGYDGLERPTTVTDSRSNTTTTYYIAGTAMPSQVFDATSTKVASYGYDTSGRRNSGSDALGNVSYSSYNPLGQVTGQWGTGSLPVAFGYNNYGERTTMSTYRSGGTLFSTNQWPSSLPAADTTTWAFDGPSGLLSAKTDAVNPPVTYTYNAAGQTATRVWSRNITTTYTYDTNTGLGNGTGTGALKGVSYSDSTHPVSYTYTRMGQVQSVSDATGSRTFNYTNASQPTELSSVGLDNTFYFGRVLTRKYNSDGLLPGRSTGFQLGSGASPSADLSQTYGFNGQGYYSNLTTTAQAGANSITLNYGYLGNAPLVQSLAISTLPNYAVTRVYDPKRNLLTSIQNLWASVPVSQFDYVYNTLGQRSSSKQSGTAFADYYSGASYSSVYNAQTYDGYGELKSQAMYRGTPPTAPTLPAASDQLPGHNYLFNYDTMGNRTSAGETGTATDDTYVPNNLNQYSSRTNNTVRIIGDVNATATVTSSSGATVSKVDRNFAFDVLPANSLSGPAQGSVTVTANVPGSAATSISRNYFVPAAHQTFSYDADGNLQSDGIWTYAYDAENRLSSMTNLLSTGFPTSSLVLTFTYDYLNRRVEKQVYNASTQHTTFDRRYIYDGWNLVAETDTAGRIQRSYTWGLDLAGGLSATGGIGALRELTNFTYNGGGTLTGTTNYFTQYDGNGNIVALISSGGALAAAYEYGPFGETVRNDVFDPAVADNAFKFSTKYTDAETGLVNYGNRYFSPTLGRFINRDSIGEAGGINLYGFCGNDGVNNTDFMGNSWFSRALKFLRHSSHQIVRAVLPIAALRSMDHRSEQWGENHQQELTMVAAVIASIYTFGAASAWASTEMTSSIADSAYLTAGSPIAGMVAGSSAVAAAGTEIGVVSGLVGGAAAGAVSGLIMTGTIQGTLKGAASGAIMGGIGGYYGNSWNLGRVGVTAVGGGLSSEVSGGSFKQGFEISGAIAFVTDIAYNMRAAMRINSQLDGSRNSGGTSAGLFGDAFKLGGGRFDLNIKPSYIDGSINPKMVLQFGGYQSGPGLLFGMAHQAGGFTDHVIELFAGPHDWLGHWWSYNSIGDNDFTNSPFGSFLTNHLGRTAASFMDQAMGAIDIPLAAPFAVGAELGTNAYAATLLTSKK